MRRLTIAGTTIFGLLIIATTTGNAASAGNYSPAVYVGSERVQALKSSESTSANASAHSSSSQDGLVKKCIPQACGTPWCYMTRNP